MTTPFRCPKCDADLDGGPMPGVSDNGHPRYTRAISIYSREKDRTVAWRCPDCKHEWSA